MCVALCRTLFQLINSDLQFFTMGARDAEINSFVVKFKQLWKAGYAAHLDMDSFNGKAWLGIRIQLDEPIETSSYHEHCSVSKERRKKKKTEVKSNAVQQDASVVPNEAVDNNTVDNAKEHANLCCNSSPQANSKNEIVINDDASVKPAELGSSSEVENIAPSDAVDTLDLNEHEIINSGDSFGSGSFSNDITNPVENDEIIVQVHATATFQESKLSLLGNYEVDSFVQICNSKTHLRENIVNIDCGHAKSYGTQDSLFTHELPVVLLIKTSRLWQSPRSYIWKQLGNSVWTLRDGVKVTLDRIHQK